MFYDFIPRKYAGWAAYDKGVREGITWTTVTVDADLVLKDGSRVQLDGRWTSIWEKRGNQWLIVHEHTSMPLPSPIPPGPQARR